MAVYPTDISIEIYTTSWIDITRDVLGEIKGTYGILSSNKLDRVANTGELFFTLRNDLTCIGGVDNYYTPNHTNALTGWKRGIPVRLKINYSPERITKWYGHVDSLYIDAESRSIKVGCLDYFDYFTNFKIDTVSVTTDKKIGEAIDLILAQMPIQPLTKTHYTGQDTFSTAFDTVRNNEKALSEIQKLALSEYGWVYLRHSDPNFDEILISEGRYTRNGSSSPSEIPINDFYLFDENGDNLLTESEAEIILNATQVITYQSNMLSIDLSFGDEIANRVVVNSYPRTISGSTAVLFDIGSGTIPLASGETKYVTGKYRDPDQKAQSTAGKDMIDTVGTTDYLMYENSDGTGTNLTNYLNVYETYYANTVEYQLENVHPTLNGYITKLQSRGTGISYTGLSYVSEDATSISENSIQELILDQKYQTNPYTSSSIADKLLSQLKDSRVKANSVTFLANYSDELMLSFLFVDIGSLIYIQDTRTGIDSYFYINGIEFSMLPGGIIYFTWILTDALSLQDNYWILDTSTLGVTTILGV